MIKPYSRKGDDGYTGLLGESKVPKYHPRPEAVGVLDEANAALGFARSCAKIGDVKQIILSIQRDLYKIMSEISATPENEEKYRLLDDNRVGWLEDQIDQFSSRIVDLQDFIIPGDSQSGAALDIARTIVRRAERQVAYLVHMGSISNEKLLTYLNRLSSLCFVLELIEDQAASLHPPTLARGEN